MEFHRVDYDQLQLSEALISDVNTFEVPTHNLRAHRLGHWLTASCGAAVSNLRRA
jgi:hypothetical protein